MVHEAVDRRRRRHGILEDAVPLAEYQVGRDEHRAPFIALRHEREEHLRLVTGLADIADVVENDEFEEVELAQRARQVEVALGGEELLDELIGGYEVNPLQPA